MKNGREQAILIRCWGARGAVPVSGPEFVKYGGNTPCIQVEIGSDDVLILDAGSGIRELGNRLIRENRKRIHLLLTHFHWDHIQGFPFFKPAYQKDVTIHVYGRESDNMMLKSRLQDIVAPPHFPIPFSELKADMIYQAIHDMPILIEGAIIMTIPLNHPNGGVGYKIEKDDRTFVFLTDNELHHTYPHGSEYPKIVDFVRNADLLIHDAEYFPNEYDTKKGWGHSTVDDAVLLALDANVKQLGLFHHNQDRSDEGVDALVSCGQQLSVESFLKVIGMRQGMEIEI